MWRGPTEAGQVVELRFGFSLRGVEQAQDNLRDRLLHWLRTASTHAAPTPPPSGASTWTRSSVDTSNEDRRTVFSTALYHSLIKPCFAANESPFWPMDGPFVFDLCTMWDIYRTQLPLITALFPDRAVELANALLNVCEEEGNLPIGYRMAKGADRFSRQGSALAQTFLADLCQLGVSGIDWDWALCHMDADLRRAYGEEYLLRGVTHPVTHTLDLSFGYHCTAQVARHLGDYAAGQAVRRAGHPVGERLRPRDRPADRLDLLRGRPVELLVPDPARHAGPDRARRRRRRGSWRCSTSSSATAPTRSSRSASARASRSWPPATRSTASRV